MAAMVASFMNPRKVDRFPFPAFCKIGVSDFSEMFSVRQQYQD
jgi:hypothetical protein